MPASWRSDSRIRDENAHHYRRQLAAIEAGRYDEVPELESAPGSVAQVRECAARLMMVAKGRGIATFLVLRERRDGADVIVDALVVEAVGKSSPSLLGEGDHSPGEENAGGGVGANPSTTAFGSGPPPHEIVGRN